MSKPLEDIKPHIIRYSKNTQRMNRENNKAEASASLAEIIKFIRLSPEHSVDVLEMISSLKGSLKEPLIEVITHIPNEYVTQEERNFLVSQLVLQSHNDRFSPFNIHPQGEPSAHFKTVSFCDDPKIIAEFFKNTVLAFADVIPALGYKVGIDEAYQDGNHLDRIHLTVTYNGYHFPSYDLPPLLKHPTSRPIPV